MIFKVNMFEIAVERMTCIYKKIVSPSLRKWICRPIIATNPCSSCRYYRFEEFQYFPTYSLSVAKFGPGLFISKRLYNTTSLVKIKFQGGVIALAMGAKAYLVLLLKTWEAQDKSSTSADLELNHADIYFAFPAIVRLLNTFFVPVTSKITTSYCSHAQEILRRQCRRVLISPVQNVSLFLLLSVWAALCRTVFGQRRIFQTCFHIHCRKWYI